MKVVRIHIMSIKLKYILTGTGRCGTNYMARFFTDLGINCGHEAIFNTDGISQAVKKLNGNVKIETSHCSRFDIIKNQAIKKWFSDQNLKADCSYMAVPFLSHACLSDAKLIHIIRNPLLTLGSFVLDVKFFDPLDQSQIPWRNFVLHHMPEITNENSLIEKTCRYLINWNKKIEDCKLLKIKVRMEDYPFEELFKFMDIEKPDIILENKKINSWNKRKRELTIDDIPNGKTKEEFVHFMKTNGYGIPKLL